MNTRKSLSFALALTATLITSVGALGQDSEPAPAPTLPNVDASLASNKVSTLKFTADGSFSFSKRAMQNFRQAAQASSLRFELGGVVVGGFKTLSGMDSETEVVEFRSASDTVDRKRPGKPKYSNITLVYPGGAQDGGLGEFKKEVESGMRQTRSGQVVVFDDQGLEIQRLELIDCFPQSFKSLAGGDQMITFRCASGWKEFSPAEEQLKGNPRH